MYVCVCVLPASESANENIVIYMNGMQKRYMSMSSLTSSVLYVTPDTRSLMYTLLLYWLYFHEETSVCGINGIWMNHNNVCWFSRRNFDCVNVGVTGSVKSLYVTFMRTKGLFILLMIANAALQKIDPIYYNDFICIYGYCSLQNRWFIFHFYLKYQIVLNHIKPFFYIWLSMWRQ